MDNKNLISQMENLKNNYLLTMASIALFSDKRSYPILDEAKCSWGNNSMDFKQVTVLMKNENDRYLVCNEFTRMGLRTLTKESVRIIIDYSDKSGQFSKLTSQIWWEFARIIGNAVSHNSRFEFRPRDKRVLPVTWNNKTIDSSLDNTDVQLSFFGYSECWELFQEMYSFVKNTLT